MPAKVETNRDLKIRLSGLLDIALGGSFGHFPIVGGGWVTEAYRPSTETLYRSLWWRLSPHLSPPGFPSVVRGVWEGCRFVMITFPLTQGCPLSERSEYALLGSDCVSAEGMHSLPTKLEIVQESAR